jgi:hypothetical protein
VDAPDLHSAAAVAETLRGMADILDAAGDRLPDRFIAPKVTILSGYADDDLALLVQALEPETVTVENGTGYVVRDVGVGSIAIYVSASRVSRRVERTTEVLEPLPVAELAKLTQSPAEAMREHGIDVADG